MKYQFSGRSRVPIKDRKEGLYYYELRDCDPDETGFTIEHCAFVNNIGCLVTDEDILGDKLFITDEEFEALNGEETTDFL